MNYSARKEGNYDWQRVSALLKEREKAQKQAYKIQTKTQRSQRTTRQAQTADAIMADYDRWLKVQEAQSYIDSRTPTENSAESIMADYDNWLKAQEAPVQKAQDAPVQKAVQKEERQKQIPVLQDNRVFNEQDARKRQTEEVMKNRVFDEESAKKRQAEQESAVKEADFKKAKKKYAADMSGVDKGQAVSQLASDLRQARTPEVNEAQALVDKESFTKDDKKRAEEILKKYDTETVRKDPSLSALRERMLSDNAALGATAGAVSQLGKRYYVGDKLAAKATGGKTLAEREAEANPVYRQNKIAAANAENNGDQALADAYMQAMQGLVDQNDIGKMDAAAARDNKYSYGAGKMAAQVGENIMLNGLLNNAGIAVNTGFTKLHKALDFLAKQGINSIPDIIGDTIPTVAEAYDEGQRGNELALTAGANLGGNILLNAGTDIAPDVAKAVAERFLQADPKYLAGLRKYGDEVLHPLAEGADNAARNADIASLAKPVAQEIPNHLDPATMAKQAAEGVDDLAAQSKQAAETIENLSEQVPKQDIGHEIAERYAALFHDTDPYDYMDELGEGIENDVEQMARDINEGKDLSGYIEAMEEVVDEVEDPAERAEVENLIRELSEFNTAKPAEAAQEVAEKVGSGRARIVDNALNSRKPSDTDSRVMGNMFAVIEQEVRDGKLNLSEDELTDILGAMNKYAQTGDKGALVPVDEILLKAGAEEVPLRTPRVGVDPTIAEPLDRFDIMANNIRDIIGRLDYSGNAKAEKEAGIIEQALQDYEKALNAKDAEAAKEASKTLTNARRRFHNAVEGLDGYNGELNTASMGKAIDTPRHQMAKRIGSGNSDFEIPDEPLEKRVAHPYGTTIEEHLERSKRLADRNDAAKTLTQEINKRIPDTQEATDKYVNFVNAVHNMALDDSPEAKKALQDAYDAITDVLTEPLPEETVGDAARLLDMDLQFFAGKADDAAKAVNPEDVVKPVEPPVPPRTPDIDAEIPTEGNAVSRVPSNTLKRSGIFTEEEYDSIIKPIERYEVQGEEGTLDMAKHALLTNHDATIAKYMNPAKDAYKSFGAVDVDTMMLALQEQKNLMVNAADEETRKAARDAVRKISLTLKKTGTEGGRAIQAFAKWTRTAEGAIAAADSITEGAVEDFLTKNPKYAKELEDVAGEISERVKGIYQGNPTPEARQEIISAINEVLDRHSKVARKVNDEGVNKIADAIMKNKAYDSIQEQLEYMSSGVFGLSDDVMDQVNELYDQMEKLDFNSKEYVDLENKAFTLIANNLSHGGTFGEKFDQWRYLAMLFNPVTHIRNIVGNALFRLNTSAKDAMATAIEAAADRASKAKGGIERTKSILTIKDKALVDACAADGKQHAWRELTGNKYVGAANGIYQKMPTWDPHTKGGKALNAVSNFNTRALNAEDEFFTFSKFKNAMAGYLKANGADASIFNNTDDASKELIEQARNYAIGQAKVATFHQDGAFGSAAASLAQGVSNFRHSDNAVKKMLGLGVDITIPFKKTPANILESALAYSPAEVAKTVVFDTNKLLKGTMKPNEYINHIAEGMTGTAGLVIGGLLAHEGIINVNTKMSDKEQNFNKQNGRQNLAVKIGKVNIGLDQLIPAAAPLIYGATIYDTMRHKGNGALDSFVSGATSLANGLTEMTMLSGIADTLSSIRYSKTNTDIWAELGENLAGNLASQMLPTLGKKIGTTIDDTRRSTYTDKTGRTGKFIDQERRFLQQKIPGLQEVGEAMQKSNNPYIKAIGDKTALVPSIDAKGQVRKNVGGENFALRAANNLLNPLNVTVDKTTPLDEERIRLAREQGNDNLIPSISTTSESKVGDYKMSPEEWTEYQQERGQSRERMDEAFFQSEGYDDISDADKASIYKTIDDLSKAMSSSKYGKELNSVQQKYKDIYDKEGAEATVKAIRDDATMKSIAKEAGGENASVTEGLRKAYEKGGEEAATKYAEIYNGSKSDSGRVTIQGMVDYAQGHKDVTLADIGSVKPSEYTGTFKKEGDYWVYEDKDGNKTYPSDSPQGKTKKELETYGLKGDKILPMLIRAKQTIPKLTTAQFAKTYKEIDRDSKNGLSQKEMLAYLNKGSWTEEEANQLWVAYGDDWQKKPTLKNGEWVAVKK